MSSYNLHNLPKTIPTKIDQEKLKISIIIRNLNENKQLRKEILRELNKTDNSNQQYEKLMNMLKETSTNEIRFLFELGNLGVTTSNNIELKKIVATGGKRKIHRKHKSRKNMRSKSRRTHNNRTTRRL